MRGGGYQQQPVQQAMVVQYGVGAPLQPHQQFQQLALHAAPGGMPMHAAAPAPGGYGRGSGPPPQQQWQQQQQQQAPYGNNPYNALQRQGGGRGGRGGGGRY
jgi:hypothetical protein